jgi:hypothetical protein
MFRSPIFRVERSVHLFRLDGKAEKNKKLD